MKSKYPILITNLIVIMLLSSACTKDWLEEKQSKTQAILESLGDFEALLNNTGILNTNIIAFGEVSSDGHSISESIWNASSFPNANNAYTWSQNVPYTTLSAWNNTYTRLYNLNTILDGLPKVKTNNSSEEVQKKQIRAQALFLKAATYYWLSQLYAQPYNSATASTDQGMIVQQSSDITEPVVRVTVQKTYDLILEYLNEAIISLPQTPKYLTQGHLASAYALMARTYMAMLNYEKAWEYADKSLTLNSALMNYNDLSVSATFIGAFNKEVLFHDLFSTSQLGNFITTGCLIDQALYDSYDDRDLRKTILFRKAGTTITFKGNYNNSATVLFGGIATDEVYLMRAECFARKGNSSAAMKDLNDLLKTRWNKMYTYSDKTALDANDALIKILEERKKELILRGLRWMDLRRLNKEDRFKITLTRTIGGKTYILEPNSYKYTFPMLQNIMDISGIPQTTGW